MLDQHAEIITKALNSKPQMETGRILGLFKDPRDDFLWVAFIQDGTSGSGSRTPYIVWLFNEQDGGFFQGVYCRTITSGSKEFARRCVLACKGTK